MEQYLQNSGYLQARGSCQMVARINWVPQNGLQYRSPDSRRSRHGGRIRTSPNFRDSSQHRKAKDVLADELTEDLDTRKDVQVQGPKAKSELLAKRGETATW